MLLGNQILSPSSPCPSFLSKIICNSVHVPLTYLPTYTCIYIPNKITELWVGYIRVMQGGGVFGFLTNTPSNPPFLSPPPPHKIPTTPSSYIIPFFITPPQKKKNLKMRFFGTFLPHQQKHQKKFFYILYKHQQGLAN